MPWKCTSTRRCEPETLAEPGDTFRNLEIHSLFSEISKFPLIFQEIKKLPNFSRNIEISFSFFKRYRTRNALLFFKLHEKFLSFFKKHRRNFLSLFKNKNSLSFFKQYRNFLSFQEHRNSLSFFKKKEKLTFQKYRNFLSYFL